MVMTAYVHHPFTDFGAVAQHLVAAHGVVFDDCEFLGRQLSRFVQDLHGHGRLAQIVQHPRHACLVALSAVKAQLAPEGHHKRANGYRMQVGVLVGSLEANQAQQGVRVPIDRFDDIVDEGHAYVRLNGVAQPYIGEQAAHCLA